MTDAGSNRWVPDYPKVNKFTPPDTTELRKAFKRWGKQAKEKAMSDELTNLISELRGLLSKASFRPWALTRDIETITAAINALPILLDALEARVGLEERAKELEAEVERLRLELRAYKSEVSILRELMRQDADALEDAQAVVRVLAERLSESIMCDNCAGQDGVCGCTREDDPRCADWLLREAQEQVAAGKEGGDE